MAASSHQRAIQKCYTLQEKHIHVDYILGYLFEMGVIDHQLMQRIEDEQMQFKKVRLLINHLYSQDHVGVTLRYCDILEQSADSSECILPNHAYIASRIRKIISDDTGGSINDEWEECKKEILRFLVSLDPSASARAVSPSRARHPPCVQPAGILTSKTHQRITNIVLNLSRQKADLVVDLILVKDYSTDLTAAVLQVGCNDSERYIPKLECEGLALCRQEDCQNPLILGLRFHTHLAWCYFPSNPEKFREHLNAALCLQHLVDHDALSADLMLIRGASLAYDALQSDNLTPELECLIMNTVIPAALEHANRNAVNFESETFLELAWADLLFIYIVLAEFHKRMGNSYQMTLHMMSMKTLAQKCDYNQIYLLMANTETSWFGKLMHLLNLPAAIEELLECSDPSQLLRFPCADEPSEVKEAPSRSPTITTKSRFCPQQLVKWVPCPSAFTALISYISVCLLAVCAYFVIASCYFI